MLPSDSRCVVAVESKAKPTDPPHPSHVPLEQSMPVKPSLVNTRHDWRVVVPEITDDEIEKSYI